MKIDSTFILYESVLFLSASSALLRWKRLGKADKWISTLLLFTIVQECVAGILWLNKTNNFFTYHIYTPIELFFIINFFVRATAIPNSGRVGLYIGSAAVALSILNSVFLQGLDQINSYYLLFEGIIVICLCLYSFYRLFIREDIIPKQMAVFWITCCFLFYWCLTFVNFGMYAIVVGTSSVFATLLDKSLYYANLLFYISLAFIFIYYKKLVPSGE